ncbi:unnamed protein product, partial [Schistosoma mattheei]
MVEPTETNVPANTARLGHQDRQARPPRQGSNFGRDDIQEQKDKWAEHFKELLNRPALLNTTEIEDAHTDLPINLTPPTIGE